MDMMLFKRPIMPTERREYFDRDAVRIGLDRPDGGGSAHQRRGEAAQSDHILLTDGSSSIPAVRRLFEQRVGTSRIASGGDLTSLAHGLALIGQTPDIESWSPPEEEQP